MNIIVTAHKSGVIAFLLARGLNPSLTEIKLPLIIELLLTFNAESIEGTSSCGASPESILNNLLDPM